MLARRIRAAALAAAFYTIAVTVTATTITTVTAAEEQPSIQGKLIFRDDTCFFFVLKFDDGGFGLYEFLGGPSPMVGQTFEGNLKIFGTRKIMNATENKPTMAYSETFTDSKAQMEKKIPRQCRKKKEFEALVVE